MKNCQLIVLILLSACGKTGAIQKERVNESLNHQDSSIPTLVVDSSQQTDPGNLVEFSQSVLHAIKEMDIDKLSSYIHPEEGVRFSPYSYIEPKTDRKLLPGELKDQWNSDKKYKWGTYDGSGNPINLSTKEYFKRFVYAVDFENSSTVELNNCQGSSNSGNNIKEIYEGLDFVDYYFPGSDPAMEGMDYESLRLVYKKYKGQYYLVGIVHNEWTI